MTDLRSLVSRMADELDHYRQLLTDDRREVHSLAVEARAVLAQLEPEVMRPPSDYIDPEHTGSDREMLEAMASTYSANIQKRNDAVKRKCATGYSCGASCISMNKVCRKSPGSSGNQQKMQRILALAAGKEGGPAMSGGARAKEGGSGASNGGSRSTPVAGGSAGSNAPTTKELRSAVLKFFGVTSTAALLANSEYRDLTANDAPRTFKGKNANEEWRQLYRSFVSVPKDERNLKDGGSVINGIDILKNFRPWHVFQLDPKTAKKADIDKAFRKLAMKHHPDAGGNREVFEKLVSMKNSMKALRKDSLQARLDALRARCASLNG